MSVRLSRTVDSQVESPINIVTRNAIKENFPSLLFCGLTDELKCTKLINDGETLRVRIEGEAYISGGPLGSPEYRFEEAVLHWGDSDDKGSEHTFNGQRHTLEMQLIFSTLENVSSECSIVTQKSDRPAAWLSLAAAKKPSIKPEEPSEQDNATSGSITGSPPLSYAVICIFFDSVEKFDLSVQFYNLFSYAGRVKYPKQQVITDSNLLADFANCLQPDGYYYYKGSLTVPPFSPNTHFILYDEFYPLWQVQLYDIRNLRSPTGYILNNWKEIAGSSNLVYRSLPTRPYVCPGKLVCTGLEATCPVCEPWAVYRDASSDAFDEEEGTVEEMNISDLELLGV